MTPWRLRIRRAAVWLGVLVGVVAGQGAWSRPMEVPPDSEFLVDAWETDEGLPENSATSMVQTPDGYLWFGTFNGLVRFDGIRFTVFDRSNTPHLPSAAIVSLHLDRQHRLWISTDRGIARQGADGWRTYDDEEGFTGNYVRRFAESPEGRIVVVTFDGRLFRFDNERFVELLPPAAGAPGGHVCYFDEAGVLWLANREFLGRWDGDGWVPEPTAPWTGWTTYDSATPGRFGDLWVCLRTELVNYREGQRTRRIRLREPIANVWDLREDADGTLWVASDLDGLRLVAPDGTVRSYTTTNGLTYNSLRFSFPDREGNVWIGSSGGGLMRFKRRYFANFGLAAGLPNRVVKSVTELAPGVMLLGTHGGGPALLRDGQAASEPWGLPATAAPHIWSVLAEPDGAAWIGTFGQGLYRILGQEARPVPEASLPGRIIHAQFRDSKGRIWIGGDQGIVRFAEGEFRSVALADEVAARSFRAFAEDPVTGAIWAASYDGGLWVGEADPPHRWRQQPDLPTDQLWSLLADPDGTLWVGTFGAGLCRIRNGRVFAYEETHGLPARSVAAMLDDGMGHVWIGSNRGILRVARDQLNDVADGRLGRLDCHRFNQSDGLASLECSGGYQPTACRDSTGRLWFATLRGVVRVDPAGLRLNHRPPAVVFERLAANHQTLLEPGIHTGNGRVSLGPIELPTGSRHIEIHYSGLSFTAPNKVRFQVRLDGLDPDWRDVGDLRVANLTDLRPGTYVFRVRAANNDGVWNTEGGALAFVVRPHPWQTWWFRGLGLLALMGATGVLSRRLLQGRLRSRLEATEHQKRLSRVQARLASVLENTSDFVAFSDADSRLLYMNAAGRRLVGLEPDADVSRLTLGDLSPEWPAPPNVAEAWTTGRGSSLWQGESLLRHQATRRAIPVSLVLLAHRRSDGSLDYLSAIARDRSAEKRAEELLQRENAFRESIIRKAGEGICVCHLIPDPPGVRFSVWNDQMTELTGMTLEEINTVGWQTLAPPAADDRPPGRVRFDFVARGRELVQEEWELQRKDGSLRVVLVSTGVLSADADGAVPQVLAVLHDITARKSAEAASELQRLRLAGIIDSAMDAIITVDEEARIVGFNPAAERMFRWSCGELLGTPVDRLLTETSRARLGEAMNQVLTDAPAPRRLPDAGTVSGRRADGAAFPMEMTVARVVLPEHCFYTLTCRDVTDVKIAEMQRERLESQLRQAQKVEAIGTLAGGIAHDFNNMLGVILGYAELARFDLAPGHPSLRCVDEVIQASQRAKRLVQQILAFSRKQAPARRSLSLGPVVTESVGLLRATLPASVTIVVDLHPDAPRVLADRTQLEQVLINLCTNAWQAMKDGTGEIVIRLRLVEVGLDLVRQHPGLRSGPHACLTVADNGCGMDGPTLERIFDPFFTTKPHGLGTGLGLSIVHGIIKNHDGLIAVESRPGQGTTFTLYFPEAAPEAEEPEVVVGPLRPGEGRRVLFLDDERALMELGRRTMEVLGYQVEAFDDPVAALAAFGAQPARFDVVLTDLSMPGRSGIELAAQMLAIRPDIPVVLCSGHLNETADREARRAGIRRLLSKPYSPAELSQALMDVLGSAG